MTAFERAKRRGRRLQPRTGLRLRRSGAPGQGASYVAGQLVTLQGTATDLEDGTLGGTALLWSSDRRCARSGSALDSANLSVGHHVLTLTATDSAGTVAAIVSRNRCTRGGRLSARPSRESGLCRVPLRGRDDSARPSRWRSWVKRASRGRRPRPTRGSRSRLRAGSFPASCGCRSTRSPCRPEAPSVT